jgi:hypothetical protein
MLDSNLPPEHKEIPLWGCEDIYWEDFEIGYSLRTIRRTLTEGESQTCSRCAPLGHSSIMLTFL